MGAVLKLPKSTYYYESKIKDTSEVDGLTVQSAEIFYRSRKHFGTRETKHKLQTEGRKESRHCIGQIMNEQVLVSKYTAVQFKPVKARATSRIRGTGGFSFRLGLGPQHHR